MGWILGILFLHVGAFQNFRLTWDDLEECLQVTLGMATVSHAAWMPNSPSYPPNSCGLYHMVIGARTASSRGAHGPGGHTADQPREVSGFLTLRDEGITL